MKEGGRDAILHIKGKQMSWNDIQKRWDVHEIIKKTEDIVEFCPDLSSALVSLVGKGGVSDGG